MSWGNFELGNLSVGEMVNSGFLIWGTCELGNLTSLGENSDSAHCSTSQTPTSHLVKNMNDRDYQPLCFTSQDAQEVMLVTE